MSAEHAITYKSIKLYIKIPPPRLRSKIMPSVTLNNTPTTGVLNYFKADNEGERPYQYIYPPPPGAKALNFSDEPHKVQIHDLRGKEDTVATDKNGFSIEKHTANEKDFTDEDKITNGYYAEVEQLLKERAGAKRVFIFDHTIRRNVPGLNGMMNPGKRTPVAKVHIDQTTKATIARVHRHMGDEAEELLKGRVRIINVWRPLKGPVVDHPLALCDFNSVEEQDLVPTALLYPDKEGETYSVKYNPNHKWHYLSNFTTDEVFFIKCYDSDTTKARLTPHTAFVDPNTPKDATLRESIEVRALVFG